MHELIEALADIVRRAFKVNGIADIRSVHLGFLVIYEEMDKGSDQCVLSVHASSDLHGTCSMRCIVNKKTLDGVVDDEEPFRQSLLIDASKAIELALKRDRT